MSGGAVLPPGETCVWSEFLRTRHRFLWRGLVARRLAAATGAGRWLNSDDTSGGRFAGGGREPQKLDGLRRRAQSCSTPLNDSSASSAAEQHSAPRRLCHLRLTESQQCVRRFFAELAAVDDVTACRASRSMWARFHDIAQDGTGREGGRIAPGGSAHRAWQPARAPRWSWSFFTTKSRRGAENTGCAIITSV